MQKAKSSQFVIQNGQILRATQEEHIKWCVRSVLSMQQGELVTRPELGADLMTLMFRRDSSKLREEIKNKVLQALSLAEERIEVEDIEISPDDAEPELLSVRIRYRIKESRRVETVRVLI